MGFSALTHFNTVEKSVHFPADRRFHIYIRPYMIIIILGMIALPVAGAWIQYLASGLPADPVQVIGPGSGPVGFPLWLITTHWINFFFLMLLIRSGLSILVDHPRLYWNSGCTPGSEWIRFTPVTIPEDKVWTAKEDARYISPVLGLPGYRHTIGIARSWHFLTVPFFVVNGLIFVAMLFFTDQWQRLVPGSWDIFSDAWNVFVHYATFHMPAEPNGFYHYNALQQLAYFGVIFLLAPIAMLTGLSMSPAIENRFHWYPRLFGNRQSARSIHYIVMFLFTLFTIIHISLVSATGLVRNANHITINSDNGSDNAGLIIVLSIIFLTAAFGFLAYWLSWHRPRKLQLAEAKVNGTLWKHTINRLEPRGYYTKKDISPYFWPNGKIPVSEEWKKLADNNFLDYRLKIMGLVEKPVELSLSDLQKMGKEQNITMHHCIQGWTGIAEWGGVPLKMIIDLVRPLPSARTVAFYSYGEGLFGGVYYDTHTLDNCLKPQSILAWEMNYEALPLINGAPLRLRVENQLGYKMVKWISRIEFIESPENVGKGFGGKNEDDEYFDFLADS
jgi:DMSO/TMAO reductase YedYZ molybdopterin-dependent catalytic subunit/thiosulfate reductase cytochrome b subunit